MIQAPPELPKVTEADVAIVGAGFAGAATAYHLVRRGLRNVVLVEKEAIAGVHSSGRNAAMVRQVTPDEEVAKLARKGGAAIRLMAAQKKEQGLTHLFRQTGSLLLARGKRAQELQEETAVAGAGGITVECWEPEATLARYPILGGAVFEIACFCPSDGVVDLSTLLQHYLHTVTKAGGRFLSKSTVSELFSERGRIRGLRTQDREIRAPTIVNAAGGWAGAIAELAGASPMPLSPTRRHLFVTPPLQWVQKDAPFVWDLSEEIYFRPEAGGLMLSACDVGARGPTLDDDSVRPEVLTLLHQKLTKSFPRLAALSIRKGWSGIRTLTPDGRFIIGPDPKLSGFFWVAGLGGHGVTAGSSVGELAAELILEPEKERENPFCPSRFATSSAARVK